LELDPPIK